MVADEGTSAAGSWLELSIETDPEAVEAVSEILSRAAPGGVSVEQPFTLEREGLSASPLPGAPVTVRAYLPAADRRATGIAIAETRQRLGHLTAFGLRPIGALRVREVHEEDWASAWRAHFPVLRVGRRLVIKPTWRAYDPADDDVVIALDPGMAFGTGLHPSTRLCLAGLERWADEGVLADARVLDVGSGSGILSIAAGLLGAGPVRAVDTDPLAIEATRENAARNGLVVEATTGSLPAAGGACDLVLANLVAGLLVELAVELAAATRAGGGRLLAGGIFVDREPQVRSAFAAAGLRLVRRLQETEWVALDLQRAAP